MPIVLLSVILVLTFIAAATSSMVVLGAGALLAAVVILSRRQVKTGLVAGIFGGMLIAPFATWELLFVVLVAAVPVYALGVMVGWWRYPGDRGGSRRGHRNQLGRIRVLDALSDRCKLLLGFLALLLP
jgi:prepilin signal peptidase PulO-like enzyme (type II secretory pathway)